MMDKKDLIGLEPFDLGQITNFDDLAKAMSKTAFGARQLGEAVNILEAMSCDKDCFKILTLSGAMTVAQMGLVVCDMIDSGMVNAIVSTGALITHGFIASIGMTHFKVPDGIDDETLRKFRLNRVYDTLEPEKNFDNAEKIFRKIWETIDIGKPTCSYKLTHEIGKYLHENIEGRGILKSAFLNKVPIFIPAFTDCEMGLNFFRWNEIARRAGKPMVNFEPFLDLEHYKNFVFKTKKTGIFTIGGGVPRNWAQQVAPLLDLMQNDSGEKIDEDNNPYFKPFWYGIRICPEPVHWGGLSGCTYSEGVSWGKFVSSEKGGRFAEVLCDATIAWPIIVKAVMERMKKNKSV